MPSAEGTRLCQAQHRPVLPEPGAPGTQAASLGSSGEGEAADARASTISTSASLPCQTSPQVLEVGPWGSRMQSPRKQSHRKQHHTPPSTAPLEVSAGLSRSILPAGDGAGHEAEEATGSSGHGMLLTALLLLASSDASQSTGTGPSPQGGMKQRCCKDNTTPAPDIVYTWETFTPGPPSPLIFSLLLPQNQGKPPRPATQEESLGGALRRISSLCVSCSPQGLVVREARERGRK